MQIQKQLITNFYRKGHSKAQSIREMPLLIRKKVNIKEGDAVIDQQKSNTKKGDAIMTQQTIEYQSGRCRY